jgi:hypothetical protein
VSKQTAIAGLLLALLATGAIGQESPTPSPAPERNIRISFVPPPLDGTISLGIYDEKGTLVRVLFREADINEFTIGDDAVTTTWDGKNDAGENVPPGKYSAHGFVVGDVKIEGVGFYFNDWITSADGPRFSRIRAMTMRDENLFLAVDLVPPGEGHVLYEISDKSLTLKDTESEPAPTDSHSATGRDDTRWLIEGEEVKQLSVKGDVVHRLPILPNEPEPKAIAASTERDRIFLLEENASEQRVRGFSLTTEKSDAGEKAAPEWKLEFTKSIVAHKNFSIADGKPVATGSGPEIPEKVKVKLQANPLLDDDRVTVEMMIGMDSDGSFIKSADGLPLCTISETQNLTRALLTLHGTNTLDVFQDDTAVIEHFRISGVDQMMSFDCGGFELK